MITTKSLSYYQSQIKSITNWGVSLASGAEQKRKVFLANAFVLSIITLLIVLIVNDYFISKDILAGHRRLILMLVLSVVPLLNKYGNFRLAKTILVLAPGFIVLVMPILMGDFYPNQLLWFHYGAAIMCVFPFVLYHFERERMLLIICFLVYLTLTATIDRILMHFNPVSYGFESILMGSLVNYKLPPIVLTLLGCCIVYWINIINVHYAAELAYTNKKLKSTNKALEVKSLELDIVNKNLEKLALERAKTIASKNKQIVEYAHLNAHQVRGPLARIVGLLNLASYTSNEVELKELISKLDVSANELNQIVGEMNSILSEED